MNRSRNATVSGVGDDFLASRHERRGGRRSDARSSSAIRRTGIWIRAAAACLALAAVLADSARGADRASEQAASSGAAQQRSSSSGAAAEPHIKIFCDMEGISGIVAKSFVTNGSQRYAEGQRYLMGDLNACIQGCIDGGAGRITVQDIHSQCNNVIWGGLHERAECILGNPPRFEGIEAYDGLILLGYHAKAGTPRAILAHTSSHSWKNCWINGQTVGEVALDGGRAGEHGVPVIMVSGDDKLCSEAKNLMAHLVAVEVKIGAGFEAGTLLPRPVAHRRIREGAAEAVRRLRTSKPAPFVLTSPVTLRLEQVERPNPPRNRNVKIIDPHTLEVTGKTVEEALGMLW